MSNGRGKYVSPAIDLTAFNCPHCSALAKQFWLRAHADSLSKDSTPTVLTEQDANRKLDHIEDEGERRKARAWLKKAATGRPFLDLERQYVDFSLPNVSISRCFNCDEPTLWIYNRLHWPVRGEAPLANPDLPPELKVDYDEASAILHLSARGSAALLRLTIQKLCIVLGERGQNLDSDIAALVKKGLDKRVQQALDVVRVVGNNAVHPGQIDLKDDHATAEKLFGLVNLIVEIMISQPKHVAEMFDKLPEGARNAIERRDGK